MVILFALVFMIGVMLYVNGAKYHDEVVMFNGRALLLYGACGMLMCLLNVFL